MVIAILAIWLESYLSNIPWWVHICPQYWIGIQAWNL